MRNGRLLLKIYLGCVLCAVASVGLPFVYFATVRSARHQEMAHITEHYVTDLAMRRQDPVTLRAEVNRLKHRARAQLTLYALDGRVLASTVDPPFPMLSAGEVERLRTEGHLMLPTGQHAHAVLEGGNLVAIGVAALRSPPMDRALAPIFTFLILLLVAAVFFARQLARPLQSIAQAADRFGRGELSARTNIRRSDEIGVAARAFDEMADRVTGLMRTQQELLANVSHELRTPLSRIHVAVDLLIDGVSDQAKELLPEIAHDLAELERLVDDVLEVARLDLSRSSRKSAGTPLRMETISPAELLHKAAARFRSHHQSHELVVETAATLPPLSADAVLLRRVIDNLVDNARKYSEPGTIIRATAAATLSGVRIAISDSGIGMEESDLQQVFTPFFRSDRSRSRATGGVGLGLVLARRIIEAHNGKIAITSSPGCGTTVTIDLPDASAQLLSQASVMSSPEA